MRSAHITRRQAEAMTDGLDTDDVFAVQEEVFMRSERVELERSAETDRLLEQFERELIAAQRAEQARLRVVATGQQGPRRSRRRADRVMLRSLPSRLPMAEVLDGEAA